MGLSVGIISVVTARMQTNYVSVLTPGAPHPRTSWDVAIVTALMATAATAFSRDNKWFFAVPAGVVVAKVLILLFLG